LTETLTASDEQAMPTDRDRVTREILAAVFRDEAGKLTASLVRQIGNFDLAEELVQDALLSALEHWPIEGIPRRPGAWLMAVARRKAVDRWRREQRYKEKVALLDLTPVPAVAEADDRLRLIFTCCHPALAREAQLALTLRSVLGLTTAEIARAFLTSEATVAQRIVRAKRKIVDAGIPYRLPDDTDMVERLNDVLTVLYVLFNEGYLSSGPALATRHDLSADAEWLASLLVQLLPEEPEAMGLLALMRLHLARARARFDDAGGVVLLRDQDRRLWDRTAIQDACTLVERALRKQRPGPYQVQAAIAACHAEAASWDETDWRQILLLYDALLAMTGSPVVRLNRTIALRSVRGAAAALSELDIVEAKLDGYHLYHATRAELLRDLGREEEARESVRRALTLTSNPAERALLLQRLS
jgi:RNA polymerase sigma-70 factor (ECF subfamily)